MGNQFSTHAVSVPAAKNTMETVRDARFDAKIARSLLYSFVNTPAHKNLFCKSLEMQN
jgi:hypothetical protein